MLQQCSRPLHGGVLQAIALTEAADGRFAYQSVSLAEASETPKMTKPLLAGRCAPLLPSREGVILESSTCRHTQLRLLASATSLYSVPRSSQQQPLTRLGADQGQLTGRLHESQRVRPTHPTGLHLLSSASRSRSSCVDSAAGPSEWHPCTRCNAVRRTSRVRMPCDPPERHLSPRCGSAHLDDTRTTFCTYQLTPRSRNCMSIRTGGCDGESSRLSI